MFQPRVDPVADSLALSALVGLLPLVTLFVLLGVLRVKAHLAALAALVAVLVVAVVAFRMPVRLALLAGTEGAVFGLFPILWIVICAIWLYQLTVLSGRFEDLRVTLAMVSADPRVQALVIAFCFGALLEALAGFGAPVAITGVMLMAMGFSALRAASVVLLANTAPVAFGAIATPIITAGTLSGVPYETIGGYVGRQTPVLALTVPFLLVAVVDGWRGLRQTWPIALVVGVSFAVAQFVAANDISVELTDVIASLVALAAAVGFLQVWRPVGGADTGYRLWTERRQEHLTGIGRAGDGVDDERYPDQPESAVDGALLLRRATGTRPWRLTGGRVLMAFLPYLIVTGAFALAKLWTPVKTFLAAQDRRIPWPGLDGQVLTVAGRPSTATVYVLPWLSSPGTLLLLSGIAVAVLYRVPVRLAVVEFGAVVFRMRFAIVTVTSVLALAYVMNLSGQTIAIGKWIAGAGAAFALFSPVLGWFGTAVTGSDTSANALFVTLQQTAGRQAGIDPTLLIAANTSGGVLGKMISPQNLTIAVIAVGLQGRESEILRKVVPWSLGLLLLLCVLTYLQSTPVLSWMLG